jgi:hypothetical protein
MPRRVHAITPTLRVRAICAVCPSATPYLVAARLRRVLLKLPVSVMTTISAQQRLVSEERACIRFLPTASPTRRAHRLSAMPRREHATALMWCATMEIGAPLTFAVLCKAVSTPT